MEDDRQFQMQCPISAATGDTVLLAHGGGGRLMHQLIRDVFLAEFDNPLLRQMHDGAICSIPSSRLAFTTDSYVVHPLFFPGGDIGSLAINGTVNDLAMCGARPLYLSAAFIVEEGFSISALRRIVSSMAVAARAAHVQVVTGDTKVVDRGKGDGVFINTTGVGVIPEGVCIHPKRVRPGDHVLLSGDIGAHGIAVLSAREGLSFAGAPESDSAPLHAVVEDLVTQGMEISCLRDLTRGGLATALNEIAGTADVGIVIEEKHIPVDETVRGACELLGLDPLYVANEGRFVAFVRPEHSDAALAILRRHPVSEHAVMVGEVSEEDAPLVVARTVFQTRRIVDLLSGEQLPRIC